jgi:hypothetical protein
MYLKINVNFLDKNLIWWLMIVLLWN